MRTRLAKLLPLVAGLALTISAAPAGAATTTIRGTAADGECGARQAINVGGATRLSVALSQRDMTSALYAALFNSRGEFMPLVETNVGVASADLTTAGRYFVVVCRNAQYDGLTVGYSATVTAAVTSVSPAP
jgi:hypothetical protein